MMPVDQNTLLSPLNDLVFKALFGREQKQSKIILMDFLNSVLNLEEKDKITEIAYLNPFNLKEFRGDKESIMDLKVKTQKGERINIEIQVNNVDDFRKRSLYYWAKMYGETISEAEAYLTLKKSIVINILNFNIIEETERYHTEYKILEKEEHFPLIDDLSIHYIELPKFDDEKDVEKMKAIELWLTFIKRAADPESRGKLENLVERSEPLKMAKEMLEKISADEKLRQEYYAKEKARLDAISRMKYAEIKGMEKGIEKGIEKEKIKMVKNALKEGLKIELIEKLTGLNKEEIDKIRTKETLNE